MATVAVLGLGLLGTGFAENLLQKGHTVRVWNRSAAKAAPLGAKGAFVASSAEEAVSGADRVHLILSEDDAVEAVIASFKHAITPGRPVIDHSTNLPERVAERYTRLRGEGLQYLPAPVFMSPANAREATGLMLVAGPTAQVTELTPALAEMTGKVWHVGERPDLAAAHKLAGNGLLLMLGGVLGDILKLGAGSGLSSDETLALFDTFRPTIGWVGQRVAHAGETPASFELTMARKDIRLMIETAGGPDNLTVLPVIAASMDKAIAEGKGDQDFAIFARPQ